MGHGKHFIASKKFMKAEGGIERIVWMPKALKDQVSERVNQTAKELYGIENFCDMVGDETIAEDPETLLAFLTEKGHPVPVHGPPDVTPAPYMHKSRRPVPGGGSHALKPLFLLEDPKAQSAHQGAQGNDIGVAQGPAQLRHIEIHAIPPRDQSQGHEHCGQQGQQLHHLVLLDVDLSLVGLPNLGDVFVLLSVVCRRYERRRCSRISRARAGLGMLPLSFSASRSAASPRWS